MPSILNFSCYKFVALPDAPALRDVLHARASAAGLHGTILLAEEGINFFLAGQPEALCGFFAQLRSSDLRFTDLQAKESWSESVPFRKLLVKIKREIIRMDHPAIVPAQGRAPAVDAATLQRWLAQGHDDSGRPVVTLDTRNAFEVDAGSFDQAIDWRIAKFTEFPAALRAHRAELQGKTVVSFCTGGIRCEKAALLMQEEGLEHVYQLDGGILAYFEQTGGAHYHGGCFVFDARRVLSTDLAVLSPAPADAATV